ncbi:MAG: hypothetical protein J0652_08760 [Desulfobulbaceae bacterium]|nr:hypothetical protein [Desulfobulbaceae bacterium]
MLWADSDAIGSGAISLASSTITTNGGHLWMGGGSGSTTWNGLTVGNGSAVNPAGNGITLTSSLISSGVGNIYVKGQSTDAAGVHSDGIDINYNNQTAIRSTSGSITLIGTGGTLTGGGDTPDGIRVSGSITSTTGAISLTGYASTGATSEAIALEDASISSTFGGNISLNGDTFWMNTTTGSVASSGLLTIAPTTVSRTIGIAGGSGGLSLASTYFNTAGHGFVNGFSGITVGDATSGLISVGGSALSYNDPLTLKTGNSIFFSTTSAVTGNNNALTLWTRANGIDIADDGVDGSVWMPVGSTVNTGGGNVVIGGGSNPTTGYALGDDGAFSAENNARWRGATINGTLNAGGGNISILGRGNDLITARGVSIGGAISTSGNGTVTIAGIAEGISNGLALGDSALFGSSVGTVTAVNGTISLSGTKDIGTNGINLSTAGSSITTNGTGNLVMNSTGNINATGTVTTGGITSLTAGAANNITLNNAANNFTGAVSVASGNNISIIDSNAMTLGAVNAAGTVNIATLTDDLTLTGAIATTNTTADAVQLNAGKNTAAGTATGGDIIVSGGSISTGAGGTAKLYSGSISGSTGLTTLIGSGSGNFRYNSDEAAANYTTALSTATNAIYREQPTVTTTANADSKTYSGVAYNGGNGVTYAGFANGDTSALLGGALTYGGTSQGATTAGTYTITPSGYTNGLGYALAYADGTLTINAASVPPTEPTPEPTEKQQAAIDSAQNPVLSTDSLDSISTSLAFIKVDSEPTGESDSTNGAASGPPPGREESGFMNVFVVSGGINYPDGVFEDENNNNRRRGVN